MEIVVQNAQRKVRFSLPWLKKFAKSALGECLQHPATRTTALMGLREISVRVVSDEEIARIHRDFMQIEGPTDVITFEHGDIVISAETARAYAARFQRSLEQELALYVIHGLLHLQGYDDQGAQAARRMHALQERLLAKLWKK